MTYNEIQISEDGFVTLLDKGADAIKNSAFLVITPAMVIKTRTPGRNDNGKCSIIIKSAGEEHEVSYQDRTAMELAAEDLREAMMDRICSLRRTPRRERLRSVEMILLNPNCMPTQGTEGSAGYDCFVDVEAAKGDASLNIKDDTLILDPGQVALIPLGFKLLIGNPDYEARLVPRSGKGHKGLVLGNMTGTIDSDYEGVWKMSMWNRTAAPLHVNLKEAVCQMVFDRVEHPRFMLVDDFDSSKSTDRGDGGFGSTDAKRILAKD
ncbi:hypothetical protein ITP31_003868 [Salmonella enterica]|nr:hypothetical protein [Salmonella enterica]